MLIGGAVEYCNLSRRCVGRLGEAGEQQERSNRREQTRGAKEHTSGKDSAESTGAGQEERESEQGQRREGRKEGVRGERAEAGIEDKHDVRSAWP